MGIIINTEKSINDFFDDISKRELRLREAQEKLLQLELDVKIATDKLELADVIFQRDFNQLKELCDAIKSLEVARYWDEKIDVYLSTILSADYRVADYYRDIKNAPIASSKMRAFAHENKELHKRIKQLEYELEQYWAVEVQDESDDEDDVEDQVERFITKKQYEELSVTERNQLALDNYKNRHHSRQMIGKMYERYIGYLYEKQGWKVWYRGIELGLEDGGIDLVCSNAKHKKRLLVQCKRWSVNSVIYEKHICQLFGAQMAYREIEDKSMDTCAVFVTTTQLGEKAKEVAKALGVDVKCIQMDDDYPMIKCNRNGGNMIYHLPFDQQYDNTIITPATGECWVKTVKEAEEKGYRRAFRHNYNNT